MGEIAAALHTAENSVQALGRGFDVNFDTRLLYCKGVSGSRIVEVDSEHSRDLCLYDDIVVPNVSRDIKNSRESFGRQSSGVCSFHQVRLCSFEMVSLCLILICVCMCWYVYVLDLFELMFSCSLSGA